MTKKRLLLGVKLYGMLEGLAHRRFKYFLALESNKSGQGGIYRYLIDSSLKVIYAYCISYLNCGPEVAHSRQKGD